MIITELVETMMQVLPLQNEWWGVGLVGVFCFIPIAWLVVFILVAVWVYKDANSRGMNAALWLIIVIILGIVGLIIYLLVRAGETKKAETVKRICPQCGRVVKEDVKFCPHCGKTLE